MITGKVETGDCHEGDVGGEVADLIEYFMEFDWLGVGFVIFLSLHKVQPK